MFDQETSEDPCIIHFLRLLGVEDDALHLIYANLSGYYMRKKDLLRVASIVKKRLVVHFSREVGDGTFHATRRCSYGDAEHPELHLALFKNHLFVYENTKYSSYCINNYNMVCGQSEWNNIVGYEAARRRWIRKPTRKMNSLALVRMMSRLGHFRENCHYMRHPRMNHRAILTCNILQVEQRMFENPNRTSSRYLHMYADVECECSAEKHYPIIAVYINELDEVRQFVGRWCVLSFLDDLAHHYLNRETLFIGFHNLKYDWAVISPFIRTIVSDIGAEICVVLV